MIEEEEKQFANMELIEISLSNVFNIRLVSSSLGMKELSGFAISFKRELLKNNGRKKIPNYVY